MNESTDHEDKMIKKMQVLQGVPERTPENIARGRSAFLAKAAEIRETMPERTPQRRSIFGTLFLTPTKKLGAVPTTLMVLGLLFGGSGVSVVAAQSANPQDLLYPVKIKSEDLVYSLKPGPLAVFEYCLQLTDRRVSEIVYTAEAKKSLPSVTGDRLLAHIDEAVLNTSKMSDKDMLTSLTELQDQLKNKLQTMEMLQADEHSMNAIKEVLALIQARISTISRNSGDIKQFRLEIQNGSYEAEIELERSEYEHQFQIDNQKDQGEDKQGKDEELNSSGSGKVEDQQGTGSGDDSGGDNHGKNTSATATPSSSGDSSGSSGSGSNSGSSSGSGSDSGSGSNSGSHSGSSNPEKTKQPDKPED